MDSRFPLRLEAIRTTLQPTELPVGPEAALQVMRRLISPEQQREPHPVPGLGFPHQGMGQPPRDPRAAGRTGQDDVQIRLVNCVRTRHANLAITDLQPADETRASGVPLFVNVQRHELRRPGRRQGAAAGADHVLRTAGDGRRSADRPAARVDESPMMEIERIEPGETVTQRVQVYFPAAGKHVVEAVLPDDAVAADNRRWCVIDFPEEETVLVSMAIPRSATRSTFRRFSSRANGPGRACVPKSRTRRSCAT